MASNIEIDGNIQYNTEIDDFKHSIRLKNILCIGAGHVGGPTMAVFAKYCPNQNFIVVDNNFERIRRWNSPNIPFYEPGLNEIIEKCRNINLIFSTEINKYIDLCDIIFVCTNTCTNQQMNFDNCEKIIKIITQQTDQNKIIILKSTLPIYTSIKFKELFKLYRPHTHYCVLTIPEFLSQGTAIQDLTEPSQILIGGPQDETGQFSIKLIKNLYENWVPITRIFTMCNNSAELSKLAMNAFLSQRISSVNSLAIVCEKIGLDVNQILNTLKRDKRIGPHYLKPSIGFGGSCLMKDVKHLTHFCQINKLKQVADYWQTVLDINRFHKDHYASQILDLHTKNAYNKNICIFGLSYKNNTSDLRESTAIYVCDILLKNGAKLVVYDPKVNQRMAIQHMIDFHNYSEHILSKNFKIYDNPFEAVLNTSLIAILTDWEEFTKLDFTHIHHLMDQPHTIFDGHNILDHQTVYKIGFDIYPIGKQPLLHKNTHTYTHTHN